MRDVPYAELHCISNFSFLRGASHAEELVAQAHELGYTALAITDECSLAGVVRAHAATKKLPGVKLLHRSRNSVSTAGCGSWSSCAPARVTRGFHG